MLAKELFTQVFTGLGTVRKTLDFNMNLC